MKQYTGLTVDYTSLISEIQTYVQNNVIPNEIFVWLGKRQLSIANWNDFSSQVPSINTIFADLGLEVEGCGYRIVEGNTWIRPNVFVESTVMIPLTNDECMITLYQPGKYATKINNWFYPLSLCTETESFKITEPLLIGPEVSYMMHTVDPTKKIPFLMLCFTTSAESLLV